MIDADPLFADPVSDDFHLQHPSPCRDTGSNGEVVGLEDYEGDPRIAWNGKVDMGADEFYTHLYYIGDATPGGCVEGKLVGIPQASPVGLLVGSGVLEKPIQHMWGELWLEEPWLFVYLDPIPVNGILVMRKRLSPDPAPYDIPLQGIVGMDPDSLTNPCLLEIR